MDGVSKSTLLFRGVARDLAGSLTQAICHTANWLEETIGLVKKNRLIPHVDGAIGARFRTKAFDETRMPSDLGADRRVFAPERSDDGKAFDDFGDNRESTRSSPYIETGLGAKVDALVAKSPSLSAKIDELQRNMWKIKYGPEGEGSYTELDARIIVIDGELKKGSIYSTRVLSHEVGHAVYPERYVPLVSGMTREQWVADRVEVMMKMEGEAELVAHQTFREIMGNGGLQPDQIRKFPVPYIDIYDRYATGALSREEARLEIGRSFFRDEEMSTGEGGYRDFYVDLYRDIWDQEIGRERY